MHIQKQLLAGAIASMFSASAVFAQTATGAQSDIAALKAQLQALSQKVEALTAAADVTPLAQKVVRIEQKMDIADDEADKTGFRGLKINGVIEAAYKSDDLARSHNFGVSAGYYDESALLQFTKATQGEGVDWTLRLLPGAASPVNEASVTVALDKDNRIIGGLMPDFQGYEFAFANANPALGNQLLSHNAVFDTAGASAYSGLGMSHTLGGGSYALKWLVGNVDHGYDSAVPAAASPAKSTLGIAYRADWFISEFAYVGLSGVHGSGNREFNVMALDGGYVYGDWAFSGHLNMGTEERAADNAAQAKWSGVSGLVGYKVTPRMQLLARADFIENRAHGGGTYQNNAGLYGYLNSGLGPERDSSGSVVDPDVGANLTRFTLGTNYQVNPTTQWKLEYRSDQSTGYNFVDADNVPQSRKNSVGTSIVVSF